MKRAIGTEQERWLSQPRFPASLVWDRRQKGKDFSRLIIESGGKKSDAPGLAYGGLSALPENLV